MYKVNIAKKSSRTSLARRSAGRSRVAWHVVALSSAALIVLAGCEAPAPETRLAEASGALQDTAGNLDTVNAQIQETQATLAELKDQRRRLRDKMRTLEERVAARATDVALFRAIQSALLDEPSLQEAALAAQVEDARVTLSGIVTKPEHKARAIAIAQDVGGVVAVESQIQVDNPAAGSGGGG